MQYYKTISTLARFRAISESIWYLSSALPLFPVGLIELNNKAAEKQNNLARRRKIDKPDKETQPIRER